MNDAYPLAVVRLALVMTVLVPIYACQDRDPLAPLPKGTLSGDLAVANPVDVNQFGQIAGTLEDANGTPHAFLWTPSSPNGTSGDSVFLDPPSSGGGRSIGLNDFGQVLVNGRDGLARLWTPSSPNGMIGNFTVLSSPYGALVGVDINNHGDVLANGDGAPTQWCPTKHPYVWHPPTPNGTVGRLIDVDPSLGIEAFRWYPCEAWGTFFGEEETGSLQVFGYDDNGDDQSWLLAELDAPLVAKIAWTSWSRPANEGIPLWFDGRDLGICGCALPAGVVLAYEWDFGDGNMGSGSTIDHAYADNGQYVVTLTVSDGAGASSSTSTVVTIGNGAPTGAFTVSPPAPSEGSSYVLTIRAVTDALGDLPSVQAALDCGDDRGFQPVGTGASGGSLSCSAPNDGMRTVRAQLRDKDGGVTEYSAHVSVLNVAPTVTILSAPATISDQDTYTISFRFADPGVLDSWQYTVNWGDGTSTNPGSTSSQGGTISASHRYSVNRRGGAKSATYVVTVGVSDNGGAFGSAQRTVLVTTK